MAGCERRSLFIRAFRVEPNIRDRSTNSGFVGRDFFPESKTRALRFVKERIDGWLHGVTNGCIQRMAGLVAFTGDSNLQYTLWAGTEHVGGHEAL